jgi:hypothetical protein
MKDSRNGVEGVGYEKQSNMDIHIRRHIGVLCEDGLV